MYFSYLDLCVEHPVYVLEIAGIHDEVSGGGGCQRLPQRDQVGRQ